jgi:N-acetylglucosamine kinase-like BadF-type ATPase
MQCVLAVDGGNTKTIALVAALDGTILGAGRGGCGDIYNATPGTQWPDSAAAAIANIENAVTSALQAAQVEASDLVTAVFNMAGLDWPEDFALLQAAMQERGFGRTISIQNDALGVLHAGSSDNTGVSVVCGTGGATGARGPDGRIWHSSCWQNQVQGSTQLAQKALDAVYRSQLGIDPPTTLTPRVLAFFHLHTVEEVLHLLTGRLAHSSPNIGYLAPALLDEAQVGDAAARQIVEEHGNALGNYALVAARFVGIEGTAFRLVLAGGVLRHPSPLLADAIIARVRTTSPDVQPTRYRFEPIIGVLFTALEAAEVAINDVLLNNLIPTIPAPTLFATALYPL